jgi:hypothetical protein
MAATEPVSLQPEYLSDRAAIAERESHESSCFREKDLQELQGRAPPSGRVRHLL